MEIGSNLLKKPSPSSPIMCFMQHWNKLHRTSNVSHRKTQKYSKRGNQQGKTEMSYILTKAELFLFKFSKHLHFLPASLHTSYIILDGSGVWFFSW